MIDLKSIIIIGRLDGDYEPNFMRVREYATNLISTRGLVDLLAYHDYHLN